MKTLGLVGGTSWVSTVDYYRQINEGINKKLGGDDFARCFLYSLNYGDIIRNNEKGDWEANYQLVEKACRHLKSGGAEGLVLCANTMHLFADRLEKEIGLPLVHIAEATAREIVRAGVQKVALLGTKLTMELDFFTTRLKDHGVDPIIPNEEDREFIHRSIFDELGRDIFTAETKRQYLSIIGRLVEEGAEGVILGCTEIPLLIKPEDLTIPGFDTLSLHAAAAVEFALAP